MSKTDFHKILETWCNSLMEYEKELYNLCKHSTYDLSVTFPLKVGECLTMKINCEKLIHDNEFIIKNIGKKEGK